MEQMEQMFADAISNEDIPGVVLLAADRQGENPLNHKSSKWVPTLIKGKELLSWIYDLGRFQYAHSFGFRSLKGPPKLMSLDTPIWMASWTKLMTAIAILQCVENSVIALDQDVTLILPELGVQPVLKGFDETSGRPILERRKNPITVMWGSGHWFWSNSTNESIA